MISTLCSVLDLALYHQRELPWIHALQVIRAPLLDSIMIGLDALDSMPFYYLIIILCWYTYNRKTGLRVLYLLLISLVINHDLKQLLEQPRPFAIDPSLGILTASSYGFPSGAAQAYMALYIYLGLLFRSAKYWMLGAVALCAISYSRVYLGLHFISDILGGWILGALIGWGCYMLFPRLETYLSKQSRGRLTLFSLFATAICISASVSFTAVLGATSSLGATLGYLFAPPLTKHSTLHQKIIRVMLAVAGALLILAVGLVISKIILQMEGARWIFMCLSLGMGYWVGGGVPFASKLIAKGAHKKGR